MSTLKTNVNITVEKIYFSNHDTLKVAIGYNVVDFHTILYDLEWWHNREEFSCFLEFLVYLVIYIPGYRKGLISDLIRVDSKMGRKNFNNVFQSMKGWIATAWSYKKKKKKRMKRT